jgi:hypothetical protein
VGEAYQNIVLYIHIAEEDTRKSLFWPWPGLPSSDKVLGSLKQAPFRGKGRIIIKKKRFYKAGEASGRPLVSPGLIVKKIYI